MVDGMAKLFIDGALFCGSTNSFGDLKWNMMGVTAGYQPRQPI